jgi:hypothetical protein
MISPKKGTHEPIRLGHIRPSVKLYVDCRNARADRSSLPISHASSGSLVPNQVLATLSTRKAEKDHGEN